jgi:hypothetical protein
MQEVGINRCPKKVRVVRRGLASPMAPNLCGGAHRCIGFPTRNLVALVYSLSEERRGKGMRRRGFK